MIECAAFCVCLSERAEKAAAASAGGIDRARTRVSVREIGASKQGDHPAVLAILQIGEGTGLPVVHGFAAGSDERGEFAMVTTGSDGLEVCRDLAGTRPLYVAEAGDWIASDHRFFRSEGRRLLSPGDRLEVRSGRAHSCSTTTTEFCGEFEEAATAMAETIDHCVKERVDGRRKVAVAFSGGLDSSILAFCASKYTEVVACSVFSTKSLDKEKAAKAADELDIEFEARELDSTKARMELLAMDLPFEPSQMDRSLWCIYSVASRAAAESGAELIMLGQLADELFAGYAKYERAARGGGAEAGAKLMGEDVLVCGMRGFIRDEAACSRWLQPRFPFADVSVLKLARSLPVGYSFREGVRKPLLREAARRLGIPDDLAMSPKKAAQYSSGVLRLLD